MRLNSAEFARRLTVTDGELARSPLFKSSGYKKGIKAKSHSEILAVEARRRDSSVHPYVRRKKNDKGRKGRRRERRTWHAIDREDKIDVKNLSNKIPAMPNARGSSVSGSYILFDTCRRKESRRMRENIQKSRVRIIIMAFRA